MGVSGSGKSTVGRALAERLGAAFIDADDLHPSANQAKMASGTPLTDEDRWPWLAEVGRAIHPDATNSRWIVVACSALKRVYRDVILREAGGSTVFAHLVGEPELLRERMASRSEHFMPPSLLRSQLETLEPLAASEPGAAFDIVDDPQFVAHRIQAWIAEREDTTV